MRHPGVSIPEPGSLEEKTWRKLVGQVRVIERFQEGKRISFYSYIDYGITSAWSGE